VDVRPLIINFYVRRDRIGRT